MTNPEQAIMIYGLFVDIPFTHIIFLISFCESYLLTQIIIINIALPAFLEL